MSNTKWGHIDPKCKMKVNESLMFPPWSDVAVRRSDMPDARKLIGKPLVSPPAWCQNESSKRCITSPHSYSKVKGHTGQLMPLATPDP